MSHTPPPEQSHNPSARSVALFAGGLFLLGLALALLLFGRPLLRDWMAGDEAELPQLTAASPAATNPLPEGPLLVGDDAYAFTLSDSEGRQVSLADFAGRPLVINFWATWCAPCRLEMPHLQAAYEAHRDQDLMILAVNQQEQAPQVNEFFTELGLTFTPLLDSEGDVSTAYGVLGLPSTYFVDEAGVITAVHRGILAPEQIDAYLGQILP